MSDGAASWLAALERVDGRPLAEQAYAAMRSAIVQGEIRSGVPLNEKEIALRYGCSRTPVREALLRLRDDGLVIIKAQSGTFVAPIDRLSVEEGVIVREALEPRAIAAAAARIDREALHRLRYETDLMQAAGEEGDAKAFIAADDRFHRTIIDVSSYARIGAVISQANASLDRVRHLSALSNERCEASVREHGAIIDRLSVGDAEGASAALIAHFEASWRHIYAFFDETGIETL